MTRDEIGRLAAECGVISWVKHEWSKDQFVHTDEGMDGDFAGLCQFAALVAAAEREACAKVALDVDDQGSVNQRLMRKRITAAIRARGRS
jgi:hypothetical protein